MPNTSGEGKKKRGQFDWFLLFIVIFLLGFGLVMIYSSSSYSASLNNDGDGLFYFKKQAVSIAVGLFVMLIAACVSYKLYDRFALLIFLVAVVMIPIVKTKFGVEVNGATRWIRIYGLTVQPSEFAKLAVIIITAATVAGMSDRALASWKGIVISFVFAAILSLMVLFLTENLSSAIIIAGIAFFMYLLAAPANYRPWLLLALVVAAAVFLVLLITEGWGVKIFGADRWGELMGFRGERILAWRDPEKYADGKGFQTLQSLYGIGSGGVFGKGLGKSMQKLGFLPEAQNDMIFSIICEELGLFGGLAILLMFFMLLFRIWRISFYCKDRFGLLLLIGVFSHIAIQVIINIAVVTNLFPNTGITLPFISYGGSSVIFLMAEIGIVLNISSRLEFGGGKKNAKEGKTEGKA